MWKREGVGHVAHCKTRTVNCNILELCHTLSYYALFNLAQVLPSPIATVHFSNRPRDLLAAAWASHQVENTTMEETWTLALPTEGDLWTPSSTEGQSHVHHHSKLIILIILMNPNCLEKVIKALRKQRPTPSPAWVSLGPKRLCKSPSISGLEMATFAHEAVSANDFAFAKIYAKNEIFIISSMGSMRVRYRSVQKQVLANGSAADDFRTWCNS